MAVTVALILAACGALLLLPAPLLAHARLLRSEPAADARLPAPPRAIALTFSESPEPALTHLTLADAAGRSLALEAPTKSAADPFTVAAAVPATLAPGRYTVVWQSASADGHVVRGRFTFEVLAARGAAEPSAGTSAPRAPGEGREASPPPLGPVRWIEFGALLALVGVVVFRYRVAEPLEHGGDVGVVTARYPLSDSARRAGLLAGAVLVVAALVRLYAEVRAVYRGAHVAELGGSHVLTVLTLSRWGHGWLVGAVGLLVTMAALAARRWAPAAVGALAVAAAPALTGHAAAAPRLAALAVAADVLHVLAAGAWLGTLLLVVLVVLPAARRLEPGARGALVARAVNRFSPIALAAATAVVASGVLSAWLRLGSVGALTSSAYGRVLLIKLVLVAGALVLGAYNWRRVRPTLAEVGAARTLQRSAGAELAIGAAILLATATLVGLPVPNG